MAVKFKNSININDQYTLPSTVGLTNQYLKVNDAATGELVFADLSQPTQVSTIAYEVRNETGVSIPKGSVVYISGGSGSSDHVTIALSTATSEAGSSKTFGITAETIANNSTGDVVLEGIIEGIDTSAFTAGGTLWLGDTPGSIQAAPPPFTPSHAVFVGYAVRIQQNNGSMFVKIQNGYELEELHDVLVTSATDGQVLTWDAANSYWKNVDQLQPGQSVIYTDNFTGDDSTTIFTLSNDIDSENNTSVYFDGVYQSKSNYSLSGNQLTFTAAPPNTVNIEVVSIENITLSSPAEGDYAAFYPLISDLDAEETARIAADNTLQTNINTEASTRASADTTLQGNIDTEEAARIAADSNLQTQIDTKIDGTGTANYIPKWTDGDTIGNSVIYDNGASVGIGTTSPLSLSGRNLSIVSGGNVRLQLDSTNDYRIISNTSGNFSIQDSTNSSDKFTITGTGEFQFRNNSSEVMRINSSGKLLINTTNTSAAGLLRVKQADGFTVSTAFDGSAVGFTALNNDASSNVNFMLQGTEIYFRAGTGAGAGSERMRITSAGNVGIGTTSPKAILDVAGNQGRAANFAETKTEAGFYLNSSVSTGSNSLTIGELSDSTAYYIQHANGPGTTAYNLALNPYGGNIGIGTSSPSKRFHVNSGNTNDVALFESTDSFANIYLKDNSGEMTLQKVGTDVLFVTENSLTHGNLRFLSNSGTERMRIDSSGRVGIGTSSPLNAGLVVAAASGGARIALQRANANTTGAIGQLGFQNLNGYYTSGIVAYGDGNDLGSHLAFHTTSDVVSTDDNVFELEERMRITSSGNVGIGKNSPAHLLDVNGNTQVSGTFYLNKGASDSIQQGSSVYLNGGSGASYTQLQQGVNRFIVFGFNGSAWTETMTINNTNGNVGIGTSSPSAKLDVVGTIECTSLTETSALRFKENIQEDIDASIIDKLRPVSYDWKEDKKKDYGFIAEEVNELDSTLTTQNEEGEMLGIKYTKLIPFLVKKIQEQEARIKQLENGKS